MRAEQLQLALRPRAMLEAADLGVRMTQDGAASLRRAYLPLGALLVLACGSTIELAPWLPELLLWWLKPWLERTLLAVYARQAFGETTNFAQAWEARRAAPWGPLLRALTIGRLAAWRAYALPVVQLEGQAGAARRARLHAILRGHRGPVLAMFVAFSWCEGFLWLALVSLAAWVMPGLREFDAILRTLFDGTPAGAAVLYAAYAAVVLFIEPFYVGAGFAMYLNRRVELEAWDIEQDLREAFDHG